MQISESPLNPTESEEAGLQTFREYVWYNSELCNECFSVVRDVGPEYSRTLDRGGADMALEIPDLDLTTNEWYERTEHGSQEHTRYDVNRRHGTCWCLNCGSDLTADHRDKSLADLQDLADAIASYVDAEAPITVDRSAFHRELADLKETPAFQSWETEILALAFARVVESEAAQAERQTISV